MNNRPDVPEEGKPVRASFDTEVKAGEGESRSLSFTVSSARIDRSGDTINQEGWQLDNYRKNPVVLWAHDASMLPVARATSIDIAGGKLRAVTEFTPKGMSRFNDTVFDMYSAGFLSATSVGFMPIKFNFAEDANRKFGIDFIEQELLEFSAVPVPANADALIEARSAGIDMVPMVEYLGGSDGILKMAETYVEKGDLLAWAELMVEAAQKPKQDDIIWVDIKGWRTAAVKPTAFDLAQAAIDAAQEASRMCYARRQRERRLKAIRLTAK